MTTYITESQNSHTGYETISHKQAVTLLQVFPRKTVYRKLPNGTIDSVGLSLVGAHLYRKSGSVPQKIADDINFYLDMEKDPDWVEG